MTKRLSLSDLTIIKSILEEKLRAKQAWVDSQRGYDYDEWIRRGIEYDKDPNREKLKKVCEMIEKIVNSI